MLPKSLNRAENPVRMIFPLNHRCKPHSINPSRLNRTRREPERSLMRIRRFAT